MKKFFSVSGVLVLLLSAIMILLSYVKTGNHLLNNEFLANLEDYNWKQDEPYFNDYQTIALANKSIIKSGDLSYKNQSYLNYPISSNLSTGFSTGFKNSDAIKKQAVTGVPMNSAFLPNGNYLKDFGEDKNAQMYREINSILDWNPNVDRDAKYNQGDYPLITSKKVANKWVSSQDSQVQSEIMGLGVEHTAGMNSVVGSNRIFNYNFNNWQYTDRFVAWAGANNEGIIVPPPADEINAAHINGAKIYGIIFLYGYYNSLTKSMLRDFLEKDENGNFAIVNILINMAKYMGFDGWFYNNEPNGFNQDGFIMDSQNSVAIIDQFNSFTQASADPEIKKLQIMAYKNQGRLTIGGDNKPIDKISDKLATVNNGLFTTDFGYKAINSEKWSASHKDFNSFDIHNMYNLGVKYNEKTIGTRDLRDLTQKTLNNNTYDGKNINSLAIYAGTTSFDWAKNYLGNLGHAPTISDDIYATVYANYYDDMIYTGQHRYLTNDDKGSTANNENQDLSYGIGDLVQENTILFDDETGIDNVDNFKTNFSTGQGQMFVSDDGTIVKNYPWNNRRLFDTQPTYKWNIESNQDKTPIKDITGFYDYYDSYRKGNSLALGSSFDKAGKILPFVLKDKINWNIMGTNYNSANKNISFTYKISDENDQWANVKDAFHVNILVTFDDGSTKEITGANSAPDANGWVTVSSNLAAAIGGGNSNSKIAKLGLTIAPDSDNEHAQAAIKVNVGEMTVNFKNQVPPSKQQSYISNLTTESAITRNNRTSLRLNWDTNSSLSDQIAYYEIYLQKTSGDTLFVGQTVNKNYYLRNLAITNNDKIIIKTINRYNPVNSSFQSWKIKV